MVKLKNEGCPAFLDPMGCGFKGIKTQLLVAKRLQAIGFWSCMPAWSKQFYGAHLRAKNSDIEGQNTRVWSGYHP
jgi:hypothetical protein